MDKYHSLNLKLIFHLQIVLILIIQDVGSLLRQHDRYVSRSNHSLKLQHIGYRTDNMKEREKRTVQTYKDVYVIYIFFYPVVFSYLHC